MAVTLPLVQNPPEGLKKMQHYWEPQHVQAAWWANKLQRQLGGEKVQMKLQPNQITMVGKDAAAQRSPGWSQGEHPCGLLVDHTPAVSVQMRSFYTLTSLGCIWNTVWEGNLCHSSILSILPLVLEKEKKNGTKWDNYLNPSWSKCKL